MCNSLWPHGLQHTRPLYPSPTPRAYSNSCPLSQWCHPTISSSVTSLSSCPQSFPASGSFPKDIYRIWAWFLSNRSFQVRSLAGHLEETLWVVSMLVVLFCSMPRNHGFNSLAKSKLTSYCSDLSLCIFQMSKELRVVLRWANQETSAK